MLTQVVNAQPAGTVISSYTYTNDLLGRRTSKNDEQYGYNIRDELIAADEVSYAYDGIGNRTTAEGKSYTANNLNQYTAIDDFTPTYDLDGNQTTVKTATGIWQVEYNAENRPIRWTQGTKVITMAFDRLGRRVFYREMVGDEQVTHTVFLYNGHLCIQQILSNEPWNVYKEFIWDPTEPVATRPLAFRQYGKTATFLMHDGNKNVTDVVTVGPANTPVAHYDYAPFGAATLSGTRASDNPFRFSSEFADDSLALVYYNYRHYNPTDGRWLGRDLIVDDSVLGCYGFMANCPTTKFDKLGLRAIFKGVTFSSQPTDVTSQELIIGGEIIYSYKKVKTTISKCCAEMYGREDEMELRIEVKMYLDKSHPRYHYALKHEMQHCAIAKQKINLFDLYSHNGTCYSKSCFRALDAYYTSAMKLIANLVNYENMLFDWDDYGKKLSEPIKSSYHRQLTAAWQRAVDNSEFIRTYSETLRVCAQNSRIPKPLSLLLLTPRFPF